MCVCFIRNGAKKVLGLNLFFLSRSNKHTHPQTKHFSFQQTTFVTPDVVTPDVEYANWKECAELVYSVQDSYCECLRIALHKALARDHLNSGHIC
jgi:hypothetical protein